MELCKVCGLNETARLMDKGWGEKVPVCNVCLTSGKWRELLPVPEPEPVPEAPESTPEQLKASAPAPAPKAEPKPHKHFYRKDGTCACGKKRKAKK